MLITFPTITATEASRMYQSSYVVIMGETSWKYLFRMAAAIVNTPPLNAIMKRILLRRDKCYTGSKLAFSSGKILCFCIVWCYGDTELTCKFQMTSTGTARRNMSDDILKTACVIA